MITNERLNEYYLSIQEKYTINNSNDYAQLVVASDNSELPIHNWFHFKESFSEALLEKVLFEIDFHHKSDITILDPFCGVGTTLTSGLLSQKIAKPLNLLGVEQNPFIHFVANTKCRAAVETCEDFEKFTSSVLDRVIHNCVLPGSYPSLSTFSNSKYFPHDVMTTLLKIRASINETEGSSLSRDLCRLCLAEIVEPVSSLRRDGRALRYIPNKIKVDPLKKFQQLTTNIARDIELFSSNNSYSIALGDGRSPDILFPEVKDVDLVLFSPPYPNNIDYTEVYKLETWLLEFINSETDFRAQRLKSMRSHPSCKFPDEYGVRSREYKAEMLTLLAPLLMAIPDNSDRNPRLRMIKGYFADMLETLLSISDMMSNGGKVVYVVGNSVHGNEKGAFLIAADLIIARLAELCGFVVERFEVARYLHRRAHHPILRESVVFLRQDKRYN